MAMSLLRRLFGLSVVASRQSAASKRQSAHSRRRAFFESLEDRRVLATFSEAGAVLTVTLDSGESLAVVSAGNSYSLTGNNSVDGGTTAGQLTGLGNNTVTITPDGLAAYDTVRIVDGAGNQNTRVTFNNSGANFYSDNFIVTLDQDSSVSPGEQSIVFNGNSSFGAFDLTVSTSRSIVANSGANLSSSNGNISLQANMGPSSATGNFSGIVLFNAVMSSSGTGSVQLTGRGGTTLADNYGISIVSGSQVTGGSSGTAVIVNGTGGNSSGHANRGVHIDGTNTTISSTGGAVHVTGTGGGTVASGGNFGIAAFNNARITAGESGDVSVIGTGGLTSPGNQFAGGIIVATGATIDSAGGSVQLTGQGGPGTGNISLGVEVQFPSQVTAGGNGGVTVQGTAGPSSVNGNIGVRVSGSITSNGGPVQVTGTGNGSGTSRQNHGVQVSGQISAGVSGAVTVHGTGGFAPSGFSSDGVVVGQFGTISSSGGAVHVVGEGGSSGIGVSTFGAISAGGLGDLTVEGTGGAADGFNTGVIVDGLGISSAGGHVQVIGQGGGSGTGGSNHGISVSSQISASGIGTVTVQGTGGSTTGSQNLGVFVGGNGSTITSSNGAVSVVGQGGGSGTSGNNVGVRFSSGSVISAGGSGVVTVQGTGGPATGSGNHGVSVDSSDGVSGGAITSGGASVSVTGTAGGGANRFGLQLNGGTISTALNGGAIVLHSNSMNISAFPVSVISAGPNAVTLKPSSTDGSVGISLGGADAAATLGLTDAELDRITAGTLRIGAANAGQVNVVSAVSRPASSNMELVSSGNVLFSGGSIDTAGGGLSLAAGGAVQPNSSGVDVTVGVVSFEPGTELQFVINGPNADTQHSRLNVSGGVNLTGAQLALSGTATLSDGQTFIIVNNDGVDPIAGTFNGLAQGATIENILGGVKNAVISYVGGTGNDVVLTVIASSNSAPTASNDAAFANEDGPSISINLTANDTDSNPSDNLQIISVGSSAIGLVTINPDGDSITYNPDGQFEFLAAGETDVDTFSYTISDGHGGTSTATVNVTITGQNDLPELEADVANVVISEGQTAINSGFFFDMDFSDDVTITASVGTVVKSGVSDGFWDWSHTGADDESSTVTITADDGHGGIATATFDLTVNNHRPTSIVVTNRALTGSGSNATFTANVAFTDPGDDTWTATIDYGDGTVVNQPLTSRSFALNHLYTSSGAYRVTVTVADDDGGSVTRLGNTAIAIGTGGSDIIRVRAGSVIIEQNGIEIAHLEDIDDVLVWGGDGDDEISVDPDVTIPAELAGGNGNDALVAGAGPTVLSGGPGNDELVGGSGPTTVIGGGGDNTFVPGTGPSSSGSTSPESFADSYQVTEDGQLIVGASGVLANDVLGSGSVSLSISAVNGLAANVGEAMTTQHGVVTLQSDGSFAYSPGVGCEATTDSFTYTLIDANGATSTSTVTISITKAVAAGVTSIDSNGIVRLGGTTGSDLIVLTVWNGKLYRNLDNTGILASTITEIRVWGRAGSDIITDLTGLDVPRFIHGGDGNDLLTGGEHRDVIFGGNGDDILAGLAGHDVLVGGQGKDLIVGSAGHDILVAGEVDCALSLLDLRQISQAWSSSRSIAADAVDEFLDESTHDDHDADQLTGSSGADLFIINSGDKITDYQFGKPKANKDGDVVIKNGVVTI